MLNGNYDLWLLIAVMILPVFLLIAYLTLLMMDYHSKENDDENS
jgi:hypothetical protein